MERHSLLLHKRRLKDEACYNGAEPVPVCHECHDNLAIKTPSMRNGIAIGSCTSCHCNRPWSWASKCAASSATFQNSWHEDHVTGNILLLRCGQWQTPLKACLGTFAGSRASGYHAWFVLCKRGMRTATSSLSRLPAGIASSRIHQLLLSC